MTIIIKSFILMTMFNLKKVALFVCVLSVGVLAQSSTAYSYTFVDQSVTKINENTVLFEVKYRLNFLNRDTRTPVLASSRLGVDVPVVSYSFVDKAGEEVAGVESVSMVLSSAGLHGNEYYLPAGTPGIFRLVSIVRTEADFSTEGLALRVDRLPFTLISDEGEFDASVPSDNLPSYRTDYFMP